MRHVRSSDELSAPNPLCFSFRPPPASLVFEVLEFLRKILPLQRVEDFVRANIQSHVGPIVIVATDCDGVHNFPTGKVGNNLLQAFDDARMQKREIMNPDLDLWIAPIITEDGVIAKARLEVWPAELLHQTVYATVQAFELFKPLLMKPLFVNCHLGPHSF